MKVQVSTKYWMETEVSVIYVQCPLRNNSPTSPHFSGFIWCIVFHWACHILRKILSIWIFCLLPNLSPIIGQTIVKSGEMITCISFQFSVSLNFWKSFLSTSAPFWSDHNILSLCWKFSSGSPFLSTYVLVLWEDTMLLLKPLPISE